ncbi:ArsR/SmtB family transcription factor [Pseudonocardia sp. CA-107938]|uniref:ArsR/SmtB family transcription factor n=1 Tax=Pseudonocardia sp. CA-107938 TaxID=3240021 RepID=UPI003D8A8D9B
MEEPFHVADHLRDLAKAVHDVEEPFHVDLGDVALSRVLRALDDPTRLRMVTTMYELGECECSRAYAPLGLSKSNATNHLRVLRERGLVRRTQRGDQQYVVLRLAELESRLPRWLDSVLASVE